MKKNQWAACFELFISLSKSKVIVDDISILSSSEFIEFCQHHRVIPQVYQWINKLPEEFFQQKNEVLKAIKPIYTQIIYDNLCARKALFEIAEVFSHEKIDWFALKGNVLSQIIYDNDCSRQSKDIDILVNKDNIDTAEEILFRLGYEKDSNFRFFSSLQKKIYMNISKDYVYYHPVTGICIELHWDLTEYSKEKSLLLRQTKQTVLIEGVAIPTLSQENLFIYLCAHGALTYWSRLRWLIDIRDFIVKYGVNLNWEYILSTANYIGFDRCVGQACYLLNYLFQVPVPPPIGTYLVKEKSIKKLADYIMAQQLSFAVNDRFFLRYFRYYPLLLPKFSLKMRRYYALLLSPLYDEQFWLNKNGKFSTVSYVMSWPIFMLYKAIRQVYLRFTKKNFAPL